MKLREQSEFNQNHLSKNSANDNDLSVITDVFSAIVTELQSQKIKNRTLIQTHQVPVPKKHLIHLTDVILIMMKKIIQVAVIVINLE